MWQPKESEILNILKCLLCIGVVMIHSKLPLSTIQGYYVYENFQFVFARLIVGRLCVPFFFVLSGYFFFTRLTDGVSGRYFFNKIRKRIISILIPYLIANALVLCYFNLRGLIGISIPAEGYDSLLSCFWGHKSSNLPIDQPLWYLRDLMVLSLLSPVIYLLLKKICSITILFISVIWYLDISWLNHGLVHDFGSVLFFCIGAMFPIKEKKMLDDFARQPFKIIVYVLYLTVLVIATITRGEASAKTLSLLSIPVVVCLMDIVYTKYLSDGNLIDKLGGGKKWVTATFFVFLYHYYVPAPLTKVLSHGVAFMSTELSFFVSFFLSVAEKSLYLLVLYYLLKKLFPKLTSVLLGGR